MDKKRILKRRVTSSVKQKAELRLEDFENIKPLDPIKELTDPHETAMAIFECLLNNDPEGVMEMIEIYLEAQNKAQLRRKTRMPKSTMYSALKHRNPTIKTLSQIMYSATH